MIKKKTVKTKDQIIDLQNDPHPVYRTETIEDYLKPVLRQGIPLDKGVTLTEDRALENMELLKKYMNYWTVYPDRFIDTILPIDSKFNLYFFQRIILRAYMRYRVVYICAPRAFSKSFLAVLALILKCIFQPGSFCQCALRMA